MQLPTACDASASGLALVATARLDLLTILVPDAHTNKNIIPKQQHDIPVESCKEIASDCPRHQISRADTKPCPPIARSHT